MAFTNLVDGFTSEEKNAALPEAASTSRFNSEKRLQDSSCRENAATTLRFVSISSVKAV